MTPQELKQRRLGLGLSQWKLAVKLEVALNTVSRWERGASPIPAYVDLLFAFWEQEQTAEKVAPS